MIFKFIKYIITALILSGSLIQVSYGEVLPLLNDTLNKKGFMKKQPFSIDVGYEYTDSDGFDILSADIIGNAGNITGSKINKSTNGVKAEAGVYITPFLKIFIDYTYRDGKLNIDYKIDRKNNISLIKDYSSKYTRKSNEHIFMAGFEAGYEYTIKKYTPYILLKAGFGSTVSESYEDIFYNASFSLKAGSYFAFNKNFILNIYAGADYTTFFNNGLMIEDFDVLIPQDYLLMGVPPQKIGISMEYAENYDKNINMVLGGELSIYKYSSIFAEVKFINSLTVYTGVKVMF